MTRSDAVEEALTGVHINGYYNDQSGPSEDEAYCGAPGGRLTKNWDEVTCRRCVARRMAHYKALAVPGWPSSYGPVERAGQRLGVKV